MNSHFQDVTDNTSYALVPTWKRVLDIGCIALVLPILIPLSFLIGLLIKIVSPGPVLFRQERVGHLGKRFVCFKFRTMMVNAKTEVHQTHFTHLIASDSPMLKLDSSGDPRLIPFGSLLRALGLDELPQLLNVLRGEMSLVGPRPCVPYEYDKFLPWHLERFDTLPGLTGLWQVNGKNRTTFNQMIALDIQYTRNKSLWLDLNIIFKTFPAVLVQLAEAHGRGRRKKTVSAFPISANHAKDSALVQR